MTSNSPPSAGRPFVESRPDAAECDELAFGCECALPFLMPGCDEVGKDSRSPQVPAVMP